MPVGEDILARVSSKLIMWAITLVAILLVIWFIWYKVSSTFGGLIKASYGRGVGTPMTCPAGKVAQDGLCYDAPKPGYSCAAISCAQGCPAGYKEGPLTCAKPDPASFGRGAGKIPTACPSGKVNEAGLCYDNPRPGFECTVTSCRSVCPAGFKDGGLLCTKPTYERTGREPTKLPCSTWNAGWTDDGTSCWDNLRCTTTCVGDKDLFGNCYAWNLKTTCTGTGAIVKSLFDRQKCNDNEDMYLGKCYPKCKPGYEAVGTTCRAVCPAGLNDDKMASCWKTLYDRGAGTIPNVCAANEDNDAGLCYPKCKAGYHGVGPVCWGNCPSGFTDAGVMCGKPTYTRAVGTIPDACPAGYDKDGLLCYPKCKAGYHGVGPVCWEDDKKS